MHTCVGRNPLHVYAQRHKHHDFNGIKIKKNFWLSAHITEWHERGNGEGKSWTFSYTCLARTLPFENTSIMHICMHVKDIRVLLHSQTHTKRSTTPFLHWQHPELLKTPIVSNSPVNTAQYINLSSPRGLCITAQQVNKRSWTWQQEKDFEGFTVGQTHHHRLQ